MRHPITGTRGGPFSQTHPIVLSMTRGVVGADCSLEFEQDQPRESKYQEIREKFSSPDFQTKETLRLILVRMTMVVNEMRAREKDPNAAAFTSPATLPEATDHRTHQRLAGKLPTLGGALRPLAHHLWRVLSYCLLHDRLTEGCAIAFKRIIENVCAPLRLGWCYQGRMPLG